MLHNNSSKMPEMLSTKQLARMLNMSHRSLENMRQRGEGPRFIKVGRMVRYLLKDVMEWIPDLSLRH